MLTVKILSNEDFDYVRFEKEYNIKPNDIFIEVDEMYDGFIIKDVFYHIETDTLYADIRRMNNTESYYLENGFTKTEFTW